METNAELKERVELLERIITLGEKIAKLDLPDVDDMRAVEAYRENLEVIAGLDQPDDDVMEATARHYDNLKAIEGADFPSDDEIEKAAEHYATLKGDRGSRLTAAPAGAETARVCSARRAPGR